MAKLSKSGTIRTGEFVVGSIDKNNKLSVAADPVIHASFTEAQVEATRLAQTQPNGEQRRYIVLAARGIAAQVQVAWQA